MRGWEAARESDLFMDNLLEMELQVATIRHGKFNELKVLRRIQRYNEDTETAVLKVLRKA